MTPTFEERDRLFESFARALFRRDMDRLYEVVTDDFLWSYHDGESVTKQLSSYRRWRGRGGTCSSS